MYLHCDETGDAIRGNGNALYCGTRTDEKECRPLSAKAVESVPADFRSSAKAIPEYGGFDIHTAECEEDDNETVSGCFEQGDFLFSVSHVTALEFFPCHYQRYQQPAHE